MRERLDTIKAALINKYGKQTIANHEYIGPINEQYIDIVILEDFECVVLGYADSYDDATNNMFEDGDPYPLQWSDEEILQSMIKEIES